MLTSLGIGFVFRSRVHVIWFQQREEEQVLLLDLTFPHYQISEDGDEAHRDECEGDHQPLWRILKLEFLLSAVFEVAGVDVEEQVFNILVWIITSDSLRHPFHA